MGSLKEDLKFVKNNKAKLNSKNKLRSKNIDKTKGTSKGYSDAKITSYNMSTSGTSNWLSTDQKGNYAYEKYNNDKKSSNPWLKVIYNAYWNEKANRNKSNTCVNGEFWLSSRCVGANWSSAGFRLRCVLKSGNITPGDMFYSGTARDSSCHGLRPVLQVEK